MKFTESPCPHSRNENPEVRSRNCRNRFVLNKKGAAGVGLWRTRKPGAVSWPRSSRVTRDSSSASEAIPAVHFPGSIMGISSSELAEASREAFTFPLFQRPSSFDQPSDLAHSGFPLTWL